MRGMTSLMQRANAWSQLVIGAAIEVHRIKGPGLIEEIYSKCLGRECELRNIPFTKEVRVPLEYMGFVFEQPLRLASVIFVSFRAGPLSSLSTHFFERKETPTVEDSRSPSSAF